MTSVISVRKTGDGVMLSSWPDMSGKIFRQASSAVVRLSFVSSTPRLYQRRSFGVSGMCTASSKQGNTVSIVISQSNTSFEPISVGLRSSVGLRPVCSFSSYEQETSTRRLEVESDFPRPPVISFQKDLANSIHLIGHVGKKPDIKYFDTGKVCARSSLAVRKTARLEDPPSWFALEFWDELAEIAAHHLKKGEKIHVAGVVVVDKFERDQDIVTIVKVVVRDVNYVTQQAEAFVDERSPQEKKLEKEKLWQDLFGNPADWWDNRLKKMNPKYPDFKHRTSGAALWLDSSPEWVKSQIQILDSGKDLGWGSSRTFSSAPY